MDTIVNLDDIVGQSTKNRFEARIIGIVTASNRTDSALWPALAECDVIELRADGFPAENIPEAARALRRECLEKLGRSLPILLTIRLKRDGGAWPNEDAALREPIWQAMGLDGHEPGGQGPLCDWVDVEIEEFDSLSYKTRNLLQSGSADLLLSHHDFQRCRSREGLSSLMAEMQEHKPDGMKFAVTCGDRGDLGELLAFARDLAAATPNGCALSMGEAGRASRVLGPVFGCPFTYGYLTGGAVAPGQLSARELRAFFRGMPGGIAEGKTLKSDMSDMQWVDWAEARIAGESLAH
jgi:3-dehydroquinate dehydratase type I